MRGKAGRQPGDVAGPPRKAYRPADLKPVEIDEPCFQPGVLFNND